MDKEVLNIVVWACVGALGIACSYYSSVYISKGIYYVSSDYLGIDLNLDTIEKFVFGSLTVLFVLLALSEGLGNKDIHKFAGYEGIICGASAIYTGIANVLNEVYGRTVLPIGPVA